MKELGKRGGSVTKLDRALRAAGLADEYDTVRSLIQDSADGRIETGHARSVLDVVNALSKLTDIALNSLSSEGDSDGQLVELVSALEALRSADRRP